MLTINMMNKLKAKLFFNLKNVINEINNNKAIIMPTDTVIGILSKDKNLINDIKKRNQDKQVILFIKGIEQIDNLIENEKNVIKKYWPGPLTIIKNGVSYRVPKSRKILKLIECVGPIYASSANISGQKPIKKSKLAFREFYESLDKIYVISGKEKDPYPSTIIDVDKLIVVRRGYLDGENIINQIKQVNP